MADDEALREALLELKTLREREATALAQSNALIAGLASMTEAERPADALPALLRSIRESLDCGTVLLLVPGLKGARSRLSTDPKLLDLALPTALLENARPMRVANAEMLPFWASMPAPLQRFRSLLSVPIALPENNAAAIGAAEGGREEGAILCLSTEAARFDAVAQALLARLAALAAQALETLALAERNALLAAVIEGASASVAIADARREDLPLIYVNDAFLALSGFSREETLGRNCRFLAADDPDAPERRRLRETIAARGSGTFELLNRRRDGSLFWNRLTLYPIRDAEGIQCLVATQVDITAERAAAEERDAAQRRLIAALSATSEGFLLLDPSGCIVYANPRWRDFFEDAGAVWGEGASFVDVWAHGLERTGMPRGEARRRARARQTALFGGGKDREETLPDGRILLINDRPTADGGAVSIATDITSLKATERILAQRAAAIDATQDGIAVTDEDGRFVYMNPAHLALFGYESETEVLGRHWRILYTSEQAAFIERVGLPELMRKGTWRTEIGGVSRAGRPVAQEVSLSFLRGIGIVCVTRDVSERQQNERERARLRDALQAAQRQEAIGQLAAGVAHDFNNLLSVISTSTAMVEASLPENSGAGADLGRIRAASDSAGRLVTRLLDLGGRRSERRQLDMARIVSEATDLLRAGIPTRIGLNLDLPERSVETMADGTDILQIVLNLGINARDAIGGDAGEIGIALATDPAALQEDPLIGSVTPARPYARIEVSDSGAGMDAETRARIFKPYFTTKGMEGTGLGLAVVASIATKIGGAISVTSAPGQGSRFTVHWPLETTETAQSVEGSAVEVVGDFRLDNATVLVCDDMGDVGRSIAAVLERAGAEVAVCEDPRDALEAIRDDPGDWSLLLTDYDMPQMDGVALATAVREAAPKLPILLCTALAEGRGRSDLFDGVVAKPFTPAGLLAAVASAMLSTGEHA